VFLARRKEITPKITVLNNRKSHQTEAVQAISEFSLPAWLEVNT